MYDRLWVLKSEMLLLYDLVCCFLWSHSLSGTMFNNPDVSIKQCVSLAFSSEVGGGSGRSVGSVA